MSISEKIKEARLSKGWSQAKLAEKAGVHPVTLSTWENGERPSLSSLERLAPALGMSVKELLDDDASPGEGGTTGNRLKVSQDWDAMMRDLAKIDPDIVVKLRDTSGNWDKTSYETKEAIVLALNLALRGEESPKLRKKRLTEER